MAKRRKIDMEERPGQEDGEEDAVMETAEEEDSQVTAKRIKINTEEKPCQEVGKDEAFIKTVE